jgi:hypothetical protein
VVAEGVGVDVLDQHRRREHDDEDPQATQRGKLEVV